MIRVLLVGLLSSCLLSGVSLADSDSDSTATASAEVRRAVEESDPAATTAAEPAEADAQADDPMVCKTKAITGSRFKRKSCLPKSEWEAMETKAEEDFAAIRNRPVHCPDCRDGG